MPGDFLDVILLVLASAFAVAGYRQGFIIGVLSFVGFVGGAALGIYLAPGISTTLASSQNTQAVLAIVAVFLAAIVGMLVASSVGVLVRSKIKNHRSTIIDAVGGAVVNVVAILLLAWLIGSLVAYAPPFPALAREVNDSLLLRGVDRLIPQGARPGFTALRKLLTTEPYVQVFGALGAETALNVPAPNPAVLKSPGLAADKASIVKIQGAAPACSRSIEGSGFAIGNDRVVTNAHVVAGVTPGPDVYTRDGQQYPATVVLFDPERDIAVLDVPGLSLPPLHFDFARPAALGAQAIVAGYPLDRGFTAVPARVGMAESARGPDIYGGGPVTRDIYPIKAKVVPGNSGGPLLAPNGRVYGMVFAAAISLRDIGYALTAGELRQDIRRGEQRTAATSTGGCQ